MASPTDVPPGRGSASPVPFSPGALASIDWLTTNRPEIEALPRSGRGRTIDRWRWLARLAAQDLALVRLAEGQADAIAILGELGRQELLEGLGTCGVWAADAANLHAQHSRAGWHLSGTKGWCTGSVLVDHALVTAAAPDGLRLFLVDVGASGAAGIKIEEGSWPAIGLADTAAHTLHFDLTVPHHRGVGAHDGYLRRAGYGHSAAGVAACWYGGAVAVSETLRRALRDLDPGGGSVAPPDPDGLAVTYGRVRGQLDAAAAVLREAAHTIDHFPGNLVLSARTAAQTRTVVEEAARTTIDLVGLALGDSPLVHDAEHARRIADLSVYLRQHHTMRERDALGRSLADDVPQL